MMVGQICANNDRPRPCPPARYRTLGPTNSQCGCEPAGRNEVVPRHTPCAGRIYTHHLGRSARAPVDQII